MVSFIFSFFLTSLIMSILILLIWIIHSIASNIFTAKLRYATWIVILLGFLIPFRIPFGHGAIALSPQSQLLETTDASPTTLDQTVEMAVLEDSNIHPNVQNPNVITAETSPPTSTSNFLTTLTLLDIILIIWAIGVVGVLSYHITQYIKFQRQVKRWGEQEKDETTLDVFHTIQDEMGLLYEKIYLVTCPFITSSMLTGLFKPTILLPERNFDQDELALIFKHELVHYKRHDLLIKFLSLIAIAIHWYNPFIYLLSQQMQAEGEASCDEHVLQGADLKNRHFYAEVIIGMIGKKSRMTFLATNFYGGRLDIKKRLASIMDTKKKIPALSYGLLALVLCFTFFSGSVFATASNDQTLTPDISEAIQEQTDDQLRSESTLPSTNITAPEAVNRAIELVGGGRLLSLELIAGEETRIFEIVIGFEDFLYDVLVELKTGKIISLTTNRHSPTSPTANEPTTYQPTHSTTSPSTTESAPQPTATSPATTAPAPPPTEQPITATPLLTQQPTSPTPLPTQQPATSPPNNTTVSRDEAAAIALAFAPGTLIEVDNDFEHGRAVWYVAVRSRGRIYEIYVDQQTGEIIYHESEIDD